MAGLNLSVDLCAYDLSLACSVLRMRGLECVHFLILGMEVDPGPRASPSPCQMNPETNDAFCHILCLQ